LTIPAMTTAMMTKEMMRGTLIFISAYIYTRLPRRANVAGPTPCVQHDLIR
jgi:hypothetical protein